MSQYDSILKEKKKKNDLTPVVVEEKKEKFPVFILSVFAVLLILIISYIVYFNTVLSGKNIIINDLNDLKNSYGVIYNNLYLDNLFASDLKANITVNDKLDYIYIKEGDHYYLKTPTVSSFINNKVKNNFKINLVSLESIVDEDRYIKTFFMKEKTPIVESNLVLQRVELEQLFNIKLTYDYEAIITAQNHALTNEILMFKVVLVDKITSKRRVIFISGDDIYYQSDDYDLRFKVSVKSNDFSIKVYKSEELISVITGIEKLNAYDYHYQMIDKLFNINLSVVEIDGNYNYLFSSNIDNVKETFEVSLKRVDNELVSMLDYDKLNDSEKKVYDDEFKYLLEFIDKYKNYIQDINN